MLTAAMLTAVYCMALKGTLVWLISIAGWVSVWLVVLTALSLWEVQCSAGGSGTL